MPTSDINCYGNTHDPDTRMAKLSGIVDKLNYRPGRDNVRLAGAGGAGEGEGPLEVVEFVVNAHRVGLDLLQVYFLDKGHQSGKF